MSTEIKTTTCYMCACRCGIRVHLRDGELRYIDGNPAHPLNKGVICAKGASGIMKQRSPARLTRPLRRKAGAERGAGEFEPISWDEAFAMLEQRLRGIRGTDPKKFALFTGRDQMQALTGLFARQFGTPNYAAHGGFCSVNMAAGMIYTIGGSFWEFGGPDLERAKLFVMLGTAEDHHSNPLKIAISKFKRDGGRFISVNPVRTGYSAIADEWIPIRPGTDGALLLALNHELIAQGLYDREFVARYTNGGHLVIADPASPRHGLLATDEDADPGNPLYPQNQLWWDRHANRAVLSHTPGADPKLFGDYTLRDGTRVRPAFQLLAERVAAHTPEWAEAITGIPAATIRRLAYEMGVTARDEKIELPIAWTDCWGNEHQTVTGNPVAFHAMRGLAAHSNGFQTVRSLAILMSLLGTIDRPGGFRHKAPFPRAIPPSAKTPTGPEGVQPDTPLAGLALGWPGSPEDLFVDAEGNPVRIDKGFSWEYPLSVHGLMHNVITNAWRGDPYPLDTLMIFMANMAWNSTMNTDEVRKMLNDRGADGEYKIPFLVVCDAFQSETVAFADLVLPDTTYLERHDVMSMLDRPISEFDGPVDAVRVPVLPPKGECKPFQEVLIELASRLKLPAFVDAKGTRKYRDYPDFIVRHETEPGSGLGFLAGWRGADGKKSMLGEPNPAQWEMYARNNCVFKHEMAPSYRYMRNWNRGYMEWAQRMRLRRWGDPILVHLYSEVLQRFRLAAQGKWPGRQPPAALAQRVETHFDPLPFYSAPLEVQATDLEKYPLAAITQRPMAMYHSWDSQNAWLRQIHTHNYLFVNPRTAAASGIGDGAWMWVESQWGRVRCMSRHSEAVEPGTVWTWNAIGKSPGAWGLAPDANEFTRGFILNSLISDRLPGDTSNSDPVTGQAGWYDVRVRISPRMTTKQLALVIDLNVCVGCHACVTSCKEWNTQGSAGPLSDQNPYGADPIGTFFNRVQTFEVGAFPNTETVHFPKSCLHCEDPPCVPVCPTGASYKRAEDGIVLVDYDKCIGCKYCSWACPYGAREVDAEQKVMKKCTLCVDRIYDAQLPEAERKPACVLACPTSARLFGDIHDPESEASRAIREQGGYALMPEWGTQPANHYLPRRKTAKRLHPDELERHDNPLKVDGLLPRPAPEDPALDDVTSW